MQKVQQKAQINFLDLEENEVYINIINKVINQCFEEEKFQEKNSAKT